jgi:hypothetical protein
MREKTKQLKIFAGLLFICSFIALGSITTFAQRPDVPGNIGDSVRPDRSAAEDEKSRKDATERKQLLGLETLNIAATTARSADEQFQDYPDVARALGTTNSALRTEYEEEKEDIPNLQPKHLFAVKMLVITSNEVRPGSKVTKRDILKNMKNGVTPLQFLLKRGFTDAEASKAYNDALQRLAKLKKKS